MSPAERNRHGEVMRQHIERRRALGVCLRCEERAEAPYLVCSHHLSLLRRPKNCSECDQPGHNIMRCPTLGRGLTPPRKNVYPGRCACGTPLRERVQRCRPCWFALRKQRAADAPPKRRCMVCAVPVKRKAKRCAPCHLRRVAADRRARTAAAARASVPA